jgi:hypothetical protein
VGTDGTERRHERQRLPMRTAENTGERSRKALAQKAPSV